MRRCLNCGRVFDEPTTITTETGHVMGCPWCGVDDMETVEQCPDCGGYFDSSALYGGLCLRCLRDRIDYPTGLSYLIDWELLRDFMETVDGDYARTADLHALLMAFMIHETEDRNWGRETFLKDLRDFILDDPVGAKDFADWLEEGPE